MVSKRTRYGSWYGYGVIGVSGSNSQTTAYSHTSRDTINALSTDMQHIPVLLHEVIQELNLSPGNTVADCTMNGGGHAEEIIPRIMPGGSYIGFDLDGSLVDETFSRLSERFAADVKNIRCVHKNYADIGRVVLSSSLNGLLADLGYSSKHIDDSQRGFAFLKDGPLDMRYDQTNGIPAYEVVNTFEENALADIIYAYGEERFSRRIAKAITDARKTKRIMRTGELAEIIHNAIPFKGKTKIHPATKTFQALRIFVNDELGNLRSLLQSIPLIMAKGGRVAIISFHSLEDRLVKNAFRDYAKEGRALLRTKKPIIPSDEEIEHNPRSRSAKLRVIEII